MTTTGCCDRLQEISDYLDTYTPPVKDDDAERAADAVYACRLRLDDVRRQLDVFARIESLIEI
jgi:hypothetical protein